MEGGAGRGKKQKRKELTSEDNFLIRTRSSYGDASEPPLPPCPEEAREKARTYREAEQLARDLEVCEACGNNTFVPRLKLSALRWIPSAQCLECMCLHIYEGREDECE